MKQKNNQGPIIYSKYYIRIINSYSHLTDMDEYRGFPGTRDGFRDERSGHWITGYGREGGKSYRQHNRRGYEMRVQRRRFKEDQKQKEQEPLARRRGDGASSASSKNPRPQKEERREPDDREDQRGERKRARCDQQEREWKRFKQEWLDEEEERRRKHLEEDLERRKNLQSNINLFMNNLETWREAINKEQEDRYERWTEELDRREKNRQEEIGEAVAAILLPFMKETKRKLRLSKSSKYCCNFNRDDKAAGQPSLQ